MNGTAFKKRVRTDKSAIRARKSADGDQGDDETTVVKAAPVRACAGPITTSSSTEARAPVAAIYSSSGDARPHQYAGDATHTTEIDTAVDKDARTILERNSKLQESGVLDAEPNVYRGQAAYRSFVQKDAAQIGANKHTGTQGPIRAPSFVRSSARFDYQPDICKDYKETGFCGYGDNCKFLHDRGDYKSGWQLEKEWDAKQASKKRKLEEALKKVTDDDSMDAGKVVVDDDDVSDYEIKEDEEDGVDTDGLPFACFICRGDFENPVVTLCGHYFCSSCAISASRNDPRCQACGKETSGVFNTARKLIKKLKDRGK